MNAADDPLAAVLPALEARRKGAEARVAKLEAELSAAHDELGHARSAIEHIQSLRPGAKPKKRTNAQLVDIVSQQMESVLEDVKRRKAETADSKPLEGMAAVEAAIRAAPYPLTIAELTDAVHELGWHPATENQERAVQAAANRVRQKDDNFMYFEKRWLYRPRHTGHLPPRLEESPEHRAGAA